MFKTAYRQIITYLSFFATTQDLTDSFQPTAHPVPCLKLFFMPFAQKSRGFLAHFRFIRTLSVQKRRFLLSVNSSIGASCFFTAARPLCRQPFCPEADGLSLFIQKQPAASAASCLFRAQAPVSFTRRPIGGNACVKFTYVLITQERFQRPSF